MRLMLMSVVLSGITLATGVSVGVWHPRIDFASACSPAMVTLLSASCGDGLRHSTPLTVPVSVASPPEVASVGVSAPEAPPKRPAVEVVSAREGSLQKHRARRFRGKTGRRDAPAGVEALAVASPTK